MSDMLARLRKKRVLLLDDDPSMQRLVSALLKRGVVKKPFHSDELLGAVKRVAGK